MRPTTISTRDISIGWLESEFDQGASMVHQFVHRLADPDFIKPSQIFPDSLRGRRQASPGVIIDPLTGA